MGRTLTNGWLLVAVATLSTTTSLAQDLTFDQRVAAQIAMERVYHTHRIGAPASSEPPLSRSRVTAKVGKYLDLSLALEHYWLQPVTPLALKREVERMIRDSEMPERLAELFAALDHDPLLIQECLARTTLVERLTANLFAFDDRIHAPSRRAAHALRSDVITGVLDARSAHPSRRVLELSSTDPSLATSGLHQVGQVGALTEQRNGFTFVVLLRVENGQQEVARFTTAKQSRDAWLVEVAQKWDRQHVPTVASKTVSFAAPGSTNRAVQAPTACPTGVWSPLTSDLPRPRTEPTSVWTGSEVVVWGGGPGFLDTGERYDPATDSWAPVSMVDAPIGRERHTAVWTGSEMVVWGGVGWSPDGQPSFLPQSGGRYDPATDTWAPTNTTQAPAGRVGHTAIWADGEMLVWGGSGAFDLDGFPTYQNGARYDPIADSWSAIATDQAPSGRSDHVAVWTGSTMLVWGGVAAGFRTATGGRYSPSTDTWSATTLDDAPLRRWGAEAVWTGDEMIVWGGIADGSALAAATGGRYDPQLDRWTPTSEIDAPDGRIDHTIVWTGSTALIWGGATEGFDSVGLDTGSAYNPTTDSWNAIPTTNAPQARYRHAAVWNESELIVFGGQSDREAFASGGRYNPLTQVWSPTSTPTVTAPLSRNSAFSDEAVWTGSELVVWSRFGEGGRYDPATTSWTGMSLVSAPSGGGHLMVSTGNDVLVWSGVAASSGRYNLAGDSWSAMSVVNSPSANRSTASAVWTGDELLVWGGALGEDPGQGGRYDPLADEWTPTSTDDAPPGSLFQTEVWTGSELIVWGGRTGSTSFAPGGRYDPVQDRWLPVSAKNAPAGRYRHSAVWTGDEMIVWGGARPDNGDSEQDAATGGRYDPDTDSWTPISTMNAPSSRQYHTAVWSGEEMIVWGGMGWTWPNGLGASKRSGGHYDPLSDSWEATAMTQTPVQRNWHFAFWTGSRMLVWGGRDQFSQIHLSGGGLYTPTVDQDADDFCSTADCNDSDPNNWISCTSCDDADGDSWFAACDAYVTISGPDCDDTNAATYPEAPEINDATDNQCPGDPGHGSVDEISGSTSFSAGRFSWTAQGSATLYEVARSSTATFTADCSSTTTTEPFFDDPQIPSSGTTWHYLVRALAENPGSWGLRSDGAERTVSCATENTKEPLAGPHSR